MFLTNSYVPKNTNPPIEIHITRGCSPAKSAPMRPPPSACTRRSVLTRPVYFTPAWSWVITT